MLTLALLVTALPLVLALDTALDAADAEGGRVVAVVAVVAEDEVPAAIEPTVDGAVVDDVGDSADDVDAAETLPPLAVPDAAFPQLASASASAWVAPIARTVRLVKTMPPVFPPYDRAMPHDTVRLPPG